ncbi:hypothetical protein PO883_28295 [Massilia sp. DJPM01]|uniref:hypothetical protein n=1 Tax=Massilia sp. DJPM01 TaxID=3024404 RepID=UPI00259F7430|nr:hypothetical protein [Massilia sp. DJPM01]MDM5181089.1 hypothetical protein [Massilia sp. DJPM01]
MTTKTCALPVLLAALTGCVTYTPPPEGPTASLGMYFDTDSAGRMRTGTANVFANPACDSMPSGGRIGTSMGMDELDELPAQKIAAGKEFTFDLATIEVQGQANAGCSVTATFLPEAGATYEARFFIRGNTARCEMVIVDGQNRAVPFTMPDFSCTGGMNGKNRNGVGWFAYPKIPTVILNVPFK